MSKEEVSTNYMNKMKKMHGEKEEVVIKNILVTGSGREGSIGSSIIQRLVNSGNIVVPFNDDVRNTKLKIHANYDALIMCHGINHLDWFENSPIEEVQKIFDINLFGTYNIVQKFVQNTIFSPYRKKIISIGSMGYKAVLNGSAAYCASKAGLAHLMKCLAWELTPKGYDVFSIHPSNVADAPMSYDTVEGLQRYRDLSKEDAESYWATGNPRTEFLTKDEIANLVAFLLRPEARYLSGSNIELAGGQR